MTTNVRLKATLRLTHQAGTLRIAHMIPHNLQRGWCDLSYCIFNKNRVYDAL
jgi:hypothetical protein